MSIHEEESVDGPPVEPDMESLEKSENIVTRYFQESRHIEEIVGMPEDPDERNVWRKYGKERMKTVSVAIILCLHIGVEPPGKNRPNPHAKLEGWVDPTQGPVPKMNQKIASSLQRAYERWQPRARQTIPPPFYLESMHGCEWYRGAGDSDERVLFHYNGHGVPEPTSNGEIWVFNRNFTQYIPLSVFDLQGWMDSPSIYVWDCDSAETIVNSFIRFAGDHEKEWTTELDDFQEKQDGLPPLSSNMGLDEQAAAVKFPKKRPRFKECIQLAACKVGEKLPMAAELPADLFTACLTTPIHMSIQWYLIRNNKTQYFPNIVDDIPGVLTDRRTLLGELDLLLSSLFRSFLLAERIMAAYGCTVVSHPRLPSTADHPLWESWEYTIDLCISHLISQMNGDVLMICPLGRDYFIKSKLMQLNTLLDLSSLMKPDVIQDSQYNSFFIEQLRAFEVWLEYGVDKKRPPQQLPVVLQVLLSQVYRVRALELLARFLDHGQWAVGYALSVGIFPYVLKLLQSNTRELKPSLAFIWAKILAVDPGCQAELFKENGEESRMGSMNQQSGRPKEKKELRYFYFVKMLNDPLTPPRQKVVPAFVLATLFHNNYRTAQEILTDQGYVNLCTELLVDPLTSSSRLFKLWILIGLGRLWADFNPSRWQAIRLLAYAKVEAELDDDSPEVRAAAVYALGGLVKNRSDKSEHALVMSQQLCDSLCSKCTRDGAHIVREELLVALQYFVCDASSGLANLHRRLREQARSIPSRVEEEEVEAIHVETGVIEDPPSSVPTMEKSWMSARSDRLNSSRRRNNASESSVAIDELIASMKAAEMASGTSLSAVRLQYMFTSEDVACREESIKMLHILESKNFQDPTERILMAVLRLVLDPIERVSRMARVLVRYIAQLSERKEQLHREIISNVSSADLQSVKFGADGTPIRKRNAAGSGGQTASSIFDAVATPSTMIEREDQEGHSISAGSSHQQPCPSHENGNGNGVVATSPPGGGGGGGASMPSSGALSRPPSRDPNHSQVASPPAASQSVGRVTSPHFAMPHTPRPFNAHHQHAKDDLDLATGPSGGVTFTVGSPQPVSAMLSTTPIENVGAFRNGNAGTSAGNVLNTPLGPTRKMSAPPLMSTPKGFPVLPPSMTSTPSVRRNPDDYPFMNLNSYDFQPKRTIAGKRELGNRTKMLNDIETETKPWEDLVETKFVPWCARVFTEPILDLIQSEDADWANEAVLTQANATDWAIHYEEGVRQLGSDEFAMIRDKPELMGEQRWFHRREYGIPHGAATKRLISCVFSMLRPYVYTTDGDNIEMLQYETAQLGMSLSSSSSNGSRMTLVNSFPVHAGNCFSVDTACWLEVINPTSTEMLLSGSPDGVLKVWDVHLNVHSHEMEKETSLITAAFPLADQSRLVEKGFKGPTTVYDWNQSSGVLLCSGNVKVCRIWDAHTERVKVDIPTGRKTAVVALSAELEASHLIALGFRDGAVHVHDTRAPPDVSRIHALQEHSRPIVGMSVRAVEENRGRLAAASSDGLLCVWEPRMFKEPIVDVNIFEDPLAAPPDAAPAKKRTSYDSLRMDGPGGGTSVLSMRMHDSAQMLACSLSSSVVRVYDISGRLVAPLKPWGSAPLLRPAITAFHPKRSLLAVSHTSNSGEACLSIFGPPEKTTRGGREERRDRLGRR
ncbi:daf-15 [Pristionchus pacificus]|uniref:Daf-15 n=1 Tax=Pristionchus pacificus TaxID=54126 RepID=A0A2A6CFX9_PRIPA|nr:daf-15 [Pristionchus pacificus]|eukprot:PDM76953.1 daf-15 [Pristionchus pacificus]